MRKILTTKLFIAVVFFCVGFLTNHLLVKFVHNPTTQIQEAFAGPADRFPVHPEDFDHDKIMETIENMDRTSPLGLEDPLGGPGVIVQREDENFEYYDLPLKAHDGSDRKLNVEIKDGLVIVKEVSKIKTEDSFSESTSERLITLDSNLLHADQAEVLNQKDKIVIKIPKKK